MTANNKTGRKSAKQNTESRQDNIRKLVTHHLMTPSYNAAEAISSIYSGLVISGIEGKGLDANTMIDIIKSHNKEILNGDLSRVEAMLLDQSEILEALFTFFTKKMTDAQHLDHFEAYSRVALKAQNQCRQTLATLIEAKNPKRATFIKQQNNAVNQQINQDQANLKKKEKPANELLEEIPSERLDIGAQKEAVRADQEMEAVGKVDRPKNGRRQTGG